VKTLIRLAGLFALLTVGFSLSGPRHGIIAAVDGPVRVEGGLISGVTDAKSGVKAFKGMPFAAPPIGDLRWRQPAPVKAWEGVRQADQYSAPCLQPAFPGGSLELNEILRLPGTPKEDCLYLNVWTVAKSASERRPVMVWIHGGALVIGSPAVLSTDGAALAKKGVVLVSINYRLGAFGFLAHPELTKESAHHSSGNYGLLDQLAALQWVQKNIGQFGGDPRNVTIVGESAGSWSVNLLVASPLGKGLFHRAIGESGALLLGLRNDPVLSVNSQTLTQSEQGGVALAKTIGVRSLGELRAKTGEEILKAATPPGNPLGATLGATVDGWVLPESADRIFAGGRHNDVPILVGSNANEGALLLAQSVPAAAAREQASRTYGPQADAFLKLYPAATDEEARMSAMQYMGDALFGLQMRTWARLQRKTGKAAAYLYLFDRVPPDSACKCATHASEIVYAFNNVALSARPFQEADRKLAETMSSYWVNFATKGDPNGPNLPTWAVYSEQRDALMALGDRVEPRPVPHKAALDFLEGHFRRLQGAEAKAK
jgi:para-nitrobenzyl esterase